MIVSPWIGHFRASSPSITKVGEGVNLMMTGGVVDERRIPARCTLERPYR